MTFLPCLVRSSTAAGEVRFELGHPLDRYLEFVAGRTRPNTVRAVAFDLKTFFTVVDKEPAEVQPGDVFDFLAHQRGDRTVVRMADRESGLSARTIARRLSSVSGFYAYVNGLCTRPVELECRMESAWETCAYFRTGPEFVPVLSASGTTLATRAMRIARYSSTGSSPGSVRLLLDSDHPYNAGSAARVGTCGEAAHGSVSGRGSDPPHAGQRIFPRADRCAGR